MAAKDKKEPKEKEAKKPSKRKMTEAQKKGLAKGREMLKKAVEKYHKEGGSVSEHLSNMKTKRKK